MSVDLILFLILAAVAVATAACMLISRNAVYAAMFLVLNFITVAVLYLLLNAAFIAMVQVVVYAGAIMVLFLFVIMLLGAERAGRGESIRWQPPVALALGAILVLELGYILFTRQQDLLAALGQVSEGFGGPSSVGLLLFNRYLLPFEVTSVLLLVAMVGAIVIVRDERKGSQ